MCLKNQDDWLSFYYKSQAVTQEVRVKELYHKYIDHTCSDEELEELFDC